MKMSWSGLLAAVVTAVGLAAVPSGTQPVTR
jgi:hypothetical protein